jgi:hypothetical protein
LGLQIAEFVGLPDGFADEQAKRIGRKLRRIFARRRILSAITGNLPTTEEAAKYICFLTAANNSFIFR